MALAKLRRADAVMLILAGGVFAVLVSLGNWQMARLTWKLDLIEAVETRAYADPVPPPIWDQSDDLAYLRVTAYGSFRHDLAQKVKAVTGLGPGHWLMVPLRTAEGDIWINRGFVPAGSAPADWMQTDGPQTIVGLLRLTEPGGTFLESNDPAASRWVSRDIDALSKTAGLTDAAPYFIDALHLGPPEAWPRGGLTKLAFNNPHLAYALTWYAMALLLLGAIVYLVFFARKGS